MQNNVTRNRILTLCLFLLLFVLPSVVNPCIEPRPIGPKDEVGGLGRVLKLGGETVSRSRDMFPL